MIWLFVRMISFLSAIRFLQVVMFLLTNDTFLFVGFLFAVPINSHCFKFTDSSREISFVTVHQFFCYSVSPSCDVLLTNDMFGCWDDFFSVIYFKFTVSGREISFVTVHRKERQLNYFKCNILISVRIFRLQCIWQSLGILFCFW